MQEQKYECFNHAIRGTPPNVLLTILTPTLNCQPFLAATLASAEALQALLPGRVQHLIADAGSTDGTLEHLEKYVARNVWATLDRFAGLNIPSTLNFLLHQAVGAWIIVLNGDDILIPQALAHCLMNLCELSPLIVCGDVGLLTRSGELIGMRSCELPAIHRAMSVNHASTLTARSCFKIVGNFSTACSSSYDYEWLWRSRRSQIPFLHIPEILAHFRLGGLSSRRRQLSNYEIGRAKFLFGHRIEGFRYFAVNTMKHWANESFARLDPAHWIKELGRRLTRNPVHIIPKSRRAKSSAA